MRVVYSDIDTFSNRISDRFYGRPSTIVIMHYEIVEIVDQATASEITIHLDCGRWYSLFIYFNRFFLLTINTFPVLAENEPSIFIHAFCLSICFRCRTWLAIIRLSRTELMDLN